jgi:2-phosphosulfolactate phosphatase
MAPLAIHTWLAGVPPSDQEATGTCAVVIDVLRATSTIAAALGHGATCVIPRTEVDDAFAEKASLEQDGEEPILGGERGGFKVPGFDLGNSPLEYAEERVSGRPVVLCTCNGTAALERCRDAARVYAASFVNVAATVEAVAQGAERVVLCCAGKEGAPALEDVCCAGMLATSLLEVYPYEADDATEMAVLSWKKYRADVRRLLMTCSHGRYLAGLGFEEDLTFCSEVDAVRVAAAQRDGDRLVAVAQG